MGDCIIAGQSPELLLSQRGRRIETRPIKGTRPPRRHARGRRAPCLWELSDSAKDRAELVMITDLERERLRPGWPSGSVKVTDTVRLETFPKVHHLLSVVRGELAPGAGLPETLRAIFPGGSITGAPKRRAMEIIDAWSPWPAGPTPAASASSASTASTT